jgi:peptidyl-prolyl cis-trans isomerase C
MKKLVKNMYSAVSSAAVALALLSPLAVHAQNIAIVNGKAVPKARVDALIKQVSAQAAAQGQQLPPDIEQRARDKVVMDEIFLQEAEKRGLAANPEYKTQMEQARQAVLVQTLFNDFQKKNVTTDAEIKAEYEKFKGQSGGTEYRARHILVEKEEDAKAVVAKIKAGAKFEDVAKKESKDPGSGENGGDLDFASPGSYVPEFSQAMVKLKKGEMTETPVKSQFGFHIIKLEDTREAKFPPIEEVRGQIEQRLGQMKMSAFRDEIRARAKTDYKFTQ